MRFIFIAILFLINSKSFSQDCFEFDLDERVLTEIEVCNPLKETILCFISEQGKESGYFSKGIGYLELFYLNKSKCKHDFYLNISYNTLADILDLKEAPFAYSFINSRLLLIYNYKIGKERDQIILDAETEKKLFQLIESTLPPKKKIVLKKEAGKIIGKDDNFRILPLRLHGGIYGSFKKNGNIKTEPAKYYDINCL